MVQTCISIHPIKTWHNQQPFYPITTWHVMMHNLSITVPCTYMCTLIITDASLMWTPRISCSFNVQRLLHTKCSCLCTHLDNECWFVFMLSNKSSYWELFKVFWNIHIYLLWYCDILQLWNIQWDCLKKNSISLYFNLTFMCVKKCYLEFLKYQNIPVVSGKYVLLQL